MNAESEMQLKGSAAPQTFVFMGPGFRRDDSELIRES